MAPRLPRRGAPGFNPSTEVNVRFGRTGSMRPVVAQSAAFADFRRALVAAVQRMTCDAETVGFALTPGFGPLLALGAVRWVVRDRPIRTYSVGFGSEDRFIGQAQDIARYFCTEHQTIIVTPREVHSALRELVRCTEDPLTPEHVLELLLIARFAATLAAAPLLLNGFSLSLGPAENDVASCARIQVATHLVVASLFHDCTVRACWTRLFRPGEFTSSLWPQVMRQASAGMLSTELLDDPMVKRRAHPSRVFARELRELSLDLLRDPHSSVGAEIETRRPVRDHRIDGFDGSHCLPPVDWVRLVSAVRAAS